jgi:Spy/CpxP family protein refolding chaperone
MKKLLGLLTIAALFATTAIAQEHKDKDAKKDHSEWDRKIKEELKLTDDQAAKYDALAEEYKPRFDAIMNNTSLSKEAQKEQKMALKKEKQAKLMEFLTPEQQTKYKEMMDKKKKDMHKSKDA